MMMQNLALLVLLIFYGVYVLKMLLQRRKGIQTDQMGKGKQGKERWIELLLKTITYITPMVEFLSIVRNWTLFPPSFQIVGLVLAFLGDAVFVVSVISMRDSWRAGISEDKTDLVTEGIYSWSRNPAFLGFDLVYLGLLLAFFNGYLLVSSLLSIGMFHLQITKVEEPFLEKVFGEPYRQYSRRTARYLGRKSR